jgi:hypothetical protein
MQNGRKKAVSLRLSAADIERIKRIAHRLGTRDSDVIRYAIKEFLFKLSPLSDPKLKGRSLVPLFLECGAELVQQFDLDAQRLGSIINEGVRDAEAVSLDDLHLIAMTGGVAARSGSGRVAGSSPQGQVERRTNPVRRYLYDKYLYRTEGGGEGR